MMAGIRGKNTKPELQIRRTLHGAGFRFRLHVKDLPGKPDIVLPRYNVAIFVHGCFWHGHNCSLFKWPATRKEFWRKKINRNQANDQRAIRRLSAAGWRVLTVWECALRGPNCLDERKLLTALVGWIGGKTRHRIIRSRRSA